MTTTSEPRRAVPSVDALLRSEPGKRASATFGRALLKRTLQLTLDEVRAAVESGAPSPDRDEILARAAALASYAATGLTSVINATGVILHTLLRRAPPSERAARAAKRAALGYGDLEIERASGARAAHVARGAHA